MSISKAKFEFITRHHDIHQWRSLRLSDDDRTPGQIKLFCQLFPPAQYISQLQSLSVVNMRKKYGKELFAQLRTFDHLVSLTIGKICGHYLVPIALPSLNRLVVNSCGQTYWMTVSGDGFHYSKEAITGRLFKKRCFFRFHESRKLYHRIIICMANEDS
jgi:hypothetical protein